VAEFSLAESKGEARFDRCVFSSYVDYSYSSFEKTVDFASSRFQASVRFLGGFLKWNRTIRTFSLNSFVDLQEAEFEHPKDVTFQSVRLRPSWLIGTNPREFTFVNVEWHPSTLSEEIDTSRNDAFLTSTGSWKKPSGISARTRKKTHATSKPLDFAFGPSTCGKGRGSSAVI
jgi:hypothetical protein